MLMKPKNDDELFTDDEIFRSTAPDLEALYNYLHADAAIEEHKLGVIAAVISNAILSIPTVVLIFWGLARIAANEASPLIVLSTIAFTMWMVLVIASLGAYATRRNLFENRYPLPTVVFATRSLRVLVDTLAVLLLYPMSGVLTAIAVIIWILNVASIFYPSEVK